MAKFIDIESVIPQHQVVLAEKSKVLQTTTDVSSYAVKGATSVNYPSLAARAGASKAITASFTKADNNFGDDSFNLDEKLGDYFDINLHQEKQNVLNALEAGTQGTLDAIGRLAENSLITKMVAGTGSNVNDSTGAAKTAYVILTEMRAELTGNDVPMDGEVYLVPTQAFYTKMLQELYNHFRADADESGVIAKIAGIKILEPSNHAGLTLDLMYHRKGAAWAFQGDAVMIETPVAGASSVEYEISKIFGGKATQSGAMICTRTIVA